MPKAEARKIHAHFDAAGRLSLYLSAMSALTFWSLGYDLADTVSFLGFAMAFFAVMTAVSVDMMSKRIPNNLSLLALAAAPVAWIGYFMGSDLHVTPIDGVAMDYMGALYGSAASGAVFPFFGGIAYPARIGLDIAMMVIVFIPLFLSFRFGLGFGGGDVKLMTAASLYFGWPLGMDFFFLSFIIGGLFSVFVIAGRMFSRIALKLGVKSKPVDVMSTIREFPFAPAIGLAAVICFSIKMQGF